MNKEIKVTYPDFIIVRKDDISGYIIEKPKPSCEGFGQQAECRINPIQQEGGIKEGLNPPSVVKRLSELVGDVLGYCKIRQHADSCFPEHPDQDRQHQHTLRCV